MATLRVTILKSDELSQSYQYNLENQTRVKGNQLDAEFVWDEKSRKQILWASTESRSSEYNIVNCKAGNGLHHASESKQGGNLDAGFEFWDPVE